MSEGPSRAGRDAEVPRGDFGPRTSEGLNFILNFGVSSVDPWTYHVRSAGRMWSVDVQNIMGLQSSRAPYEAYRQQAIKGDRVSIHGARMLQLAMQLARMHTHMA